MMAQRTFRARFYGASILPGLRLLRLLAMNRQNASISATWSSERRTASASDRTPSALLARCRARGSTKNAFRVSARDLRIVVLHRDSNMHTSCRDRHTERFDSERRGRRCRMNAMTGCCAPAPIDSMATTAATPKIMPSMVSIVPGGGSCWNLPSIPDASVTSHGPASTSG
jgi:hypothetical protein